MQNNKVLQLHRLVRTCDEPTHERDISCQVFGACLRTVLEGYAVNKDGEEQVINGERWDSNHPVVEIDVGEPSSLPRPQLYTGCLEFPAIVFALKRLGSDGRMDRRNRSSKWCGSKWSNSQPISIDQRKARSKNFKAMVHRGIVGDPSCPSKDSNNTFKTKKGIWFSRMSRS
ncbi:hypothetical protein V6N13_084874 [Hibiscus sabdariffa]